MTTFYFIVPKSGMILLPLRFFFFSCIFTSDFADFCFVCRSCKVFFAKYNITPLFSHLTQLFVEETIDQIFFKFCQHASFFLFSWSCKTVDNKYICIVLQLLIIHIFCYSFHALKLGNKKVSLLGNSYIKFKNKKETKKKLKSQKQNRKKNGGKKINKFKKKHFLSL